MRENLGVIVGTGKGYHGQEELIKALCDEGFPVLKTGAWWPRDHYVFFQGEYVRLNDVQGDRLWNHFGEGGYFQIGDDFLIISDRVFNDSDLRKGKELSRAEARDLPYDEITDAIVQECEKYHPNGRIHVAPSGEYHGGIGVGHKHIDMFTLLLPESKILMVDTHFGSNAAMAQQYDEIARSEGLKLVRYDGSQDGVQYPLNALILPKNEEEVVFIDQAADSLARILSDEGIRTIGVEIPYRQRETGKIHCQTNVFCMDDLATVKQWFTRQDIGSCEYIEPNK